MARMKDLTGKRFGKLTVVEVSGKNKYGNYMWVCRCDCGNITKPILNTLLTQGKTRSCGCIEKPNIFDIRKKSGFIQSTNLSNWENCSMYKSNTSGFRGVCFETRKNKYRVTIRFKNKSKHIGYFNTLEEAAEARKKAEDDIKDELERLRNIFDQQED